MCVIGTWKNICAHCDEATREEKRRRIEHGWCHDAFHRFGVFGACRRVERVNISYYGKLENFSQKRGLGSPGRDEEGLFPHIEYFR